jgi:cell division protein FtsL
MIILISVLSLLIISTIFVIYNLLKKVERYEEDILLKEEYLDKLKIMVDDSYKRIKDLDTVKAFESDDEVGHFFTNLKDIIVTLNTYLQNYTKK